MNRRVLLGVTKFVVVVLVPAALAAQATLRPTDAPIVTAENEGWYLAGEPITFAGNLYYPAGPQVFFNRYEMVRSGDYRGIPLYSRTTIEPYSVVYVPLAGGLLRPYERRRDRDVAGTVGSTTPSFPVVRDAEISGREIAQAPSPPTLVAPLVGVTPAGEPVVSTGSEFPASGIVRPTPPIAEVRGLQPRGLNAIFIEYRGRRWFSSGPAVEFNASRFTRIGDYHGFPVYSSRSQKDGTIYVATTRDGEGLLAPYSLRR